MKRNIKRKGARLSNQLRAVPSNGSDCTMSRESKMPARLTDYRNTFRAGSVVAHLYSAAPNVNGVDPEVNAAAFVFTMGSVERRQCCMGDYVASDVVNNLLVLDQLAACYAENGHRLIRTWLSDVQLEVAGKKGVNRFRENIPRRRRAKSPTSESPYVAELAYGRAVARFDDPAVFFAEWATHAFAERVQYSVSTERQWNDGVEWFSMWELPELFGAHVLAGRYYHNEGHARIGQWMDETAWNLTA